MPFFFNNSHTTSPHIFTRSPPHSHSHSFYLRTVSNLVSDLFPSPSFSFSTKARSHFFSRPPFLIPIVGCTIYFTFTFHSPHGNPASSPRFGIVAPTMVDGATYWLFSLQHMVFMEKKCSKVCMCRCVAQEFAVFTGGKPWSVG